MKEVAMEKCGKRVGGRVYTSEMNLFEEQRRSGFPALNKWSVGDED